MSFSQFAPVVAGLMAVAFGLYFALAPRQNAMSALHDWKVAAAFSLLFLGFSVYAGLQEGATGFWAEHIRNLWGNQIWFDLLICACVALLLLVPRARAVGLAPLPWVLLSFATGGIGLLAFLAVVLKAEADAKSSTKASDG